MNRILFLLLITLCLYSCKKKEAMPKSSDKVIRSFTFYKSKNPSLTQDYTAVITHDTILITLSASVNISHLIPNIGYVGASLSPGSEVAQDFTHPVLYTVMAEDGSSATYKTVFQVLSNSSAITSFIFKKTNNPALANDIAGVISGDSIIVKVPRGTDITSLKPTVIYTGIATSPENEQAENFIHTIAYAVEAEDGSWRNYNVYVENHYDIFIHGDDGYLYDVNATNGSVKWQYFVGGNGVPTYDKEVVFVAGYTNFTTVIYAINADDGSLKWSTSQLQGNYTLSIPVVKYGKVYFGGNGLLNSSNGISAYYAGFIYALNEETGTEEWLSTYVSSNGSITMGNTNVTVEDNIACIYDVYYGLHVFNAVDGTSLWAGLGELGRANPAIANNSIVCGIEGGIAEIDENGSPGWNIINSGGFSSPAINNGVIYTTAAYNRGPTIYAINQNGDIKWQISPFYSVLVSFNSPFYANDNLYISNSRGELNSYKAIDGSLNWTKQGFGAYPIVVNNALFISDNSKRLICLDASSGTVFWILNGGGVFSGPACVVDFTDKSYHCTDSGEQN